MQLSMLIGKQILTPAGERLGYVTGAYLDRELKKLSALAVADAEEEEFFMPARALTAVGDAVIATNLRIRTPGGVPSPVGLEAYSDKGEHLGAVGDWLFGEEDAVLILVKEGVRTSVPVQNALMGETVIVYPEPPKKRPAPVRRPAAKKTTQKTENEAPMPATDASKTDDMSGAEDIPAQAEGSPSTPSAAAVDEAPVAPRQSNAGTGEYSFNRFNLLGRRLKKSVFDEWGLPVALAGERITPEILSRARQCNRLLTLTVNTLTNIW